MKFRCAFVVWKISFVAWGLVFGLAPRLQAQGTIAPDPKYAAISKAIESLVQREIETKELPAVSIALVDGKEIVWAKGFGFADPRKKTPRHGRDSLSRRFCLQAIYRRRNYAACRKGRSRP